ncbi:cobaltochelatase subunit CobN, partial [Thermodesulfovibrionales bacterium]|nr:cobaltochelatase subunit CobN [Thermodesulfovibrionales bacterium]
MPRFEGVPHDAALIDKIEHHLEEVRAVMISAGLHTLGETPGQTLLSETVMLMLGPAFTDEISKVGDIEEKREAQAKAKKLLLAVFNDITPEEALIDILGNTSPVLTDLLNEGRGHYQNFHASREIEAVIDVLSGRFVMPGPSGDQIHNPETLPTGRHLYAFDPRRFPTKGAWDVGRETLGQMLVEHKEEHGLYPDKLSFIVWASETMRHRGVVESQIIYAIGVEPVWDERGRVRIDDDQGVAGGLRIIPDEELGRPRVDVTAIITGTYRNTFPCRVKVIDAAVRLVAAHEEEGQINHIRQNYLALKDELINVQGMSSETAHELAAARVFGPPLEELGARIGGIIKASLTDDRVLLADLFLSQFAHIYSATSWGEAHEDISRRALSGTDIALFSRSSPRGGLVSGTCCCPSAFLGGLSMAIERIDGVLPQTMVSNLRDAFNPGIVTADEFLRTEVRTTLNNPRWIEAMKAEGYSGAREMHHIVNHVWVWEGTTPHIITGDMWNDIYEVYVEDRYNLNMEEFFNEFHPHAQQAIVARLLEVIKAGEWEADPAIIQELMERFIESVAKHGMTCLAAQCANPRLDQFLVEQVKEGRVRLDRETIAQFDEQRVATLGVGLAGLEAALEVAPEVVIEPPAELLREVVGEVMEVVQPEAPHFHLDLPVSKLIAAFILIALIGVGYLVITKKAKK